MPIATQAFPTDNLLVCAQCREKFSLTKGPDPRYACHGPCGHSYRALELNRLSLPQITAAVITNVTFHSVSDGLDHMYREATGQEADNFPSDQEIRRLTANPDFLLIENTVQDFAAWLASFIRRIELAPGRATVHYTHNLPPGSILEGARTQDIELPDSVTSSPPAVTQTTRTLVES